VKVLRDLKLGVPSVQVEDLIARLEARLDDGWSRDREAEPSPERQPYDIRFFYFVCNKKAEREPALLSLVQDRDGSIYVSNIVPKDKQHLSWNEYNYILEEFHDRFVKPVAEELHLKVVFTADEQTIEDWVSKESAEKLRYFSRAANKSTGSSHPLDEQRWFDFIVSVAQKNDHLDAPRLRQWLIENGWTEDIAHELSSDYEKGIALLKYYRSH